MESVSEFPRFHDGDVSVVVSPSRIYQLHSSTLRRLSPYFAAQIDNIPGARLTAAAKREGAAAYRFELSRSNRSNEFGKFVRIKVNDNGRLHRDFQNLGEIITPVDDFKAQIWEWLFASFYNIAPKFEDYNLGVILRSCMNLVDAADSIGSIEHVREIVDLALLRQDQVLWTAIARNPTAWTELGRRIHSQSIFREGVVHLVGLWNRMSDEARFELDDTIRNLCQKKREELDFAMQAINLRILGHYPSFLSRNSVHKPQRTSYSTDIYMWMAISFYRHFFAQSISNRETRDAADGGWKFYRMLAEGGSAYLHHEDFRTFYQYFPMSSKACNVLEANMNVLKEDIKVFVKDLMISRVHVKPGDCHIEWLTCAVVEKEDLPWLSSNELETEAHHGRIFEAIDRPQITLSGYGPAQSCSSPGAAETNTSDLLQDSQLDLNGYGDIHLSQGFLHEMNNNGSGTPTGNKATKRDQEDTDDEPPEYGVEFPSVGENFFSGN